MGNDKNKPKREHHILPKLYLKGFVIKEGEPFIWVYKHGEPYNPGQGRITNNPYRASIGKLSVRDYYAYPEEEGKKDFETYENILESLEKPANLVFEKIRKYKAITFGEKHAFSLYTIYRADV